MTTARKISLCLVFLDYLVEEISERVVSNDECGFCVSYLNPASLLNLTPEIVDRLYNAYRTGLPRKVDFVNEVGRWKIRWALVDDKVETTRHSTCNKP